MNIYYKIIPVLFLFIITINQITVGQSNEELVQKGINEYQDGNYEDAVDLFDNALKNIKSTEQDLHIDNF